MGSPSAGVKKEKVGKTSHFLGLKRNVNMSKIEGDTSEVTINN